MYTSRRFNPAIQAWITPRVHMFTQSITEDASKIITAGEKGKFYGGGNTYGRLPSGPTTIEGLGPGPCQGGLWDKRGNYHCCSYL